MENLTNDILHNEHTLLRFGYRLDHRMPWYTLTRDVSAVRIDAHSYAHALHLAVELLRSRA